MSRFLQYNTAHKERARKPRRETTPEEQAIWRAVRRKQIRGVTFHRQKPLGQFIADFYCPKAALVVELDGLQHFEPGHAVADCQRNEILSEMGLRTLRFSNLEVRRALGSVLSEIDRVTAERLAELDASRSAK